MKVYILKKETRYAYPDNGIDIGDTLGVYSSLEAGIRASTFLDFASWEQNISEEVPLRWWLTPLVWEDGGKRHWFEILEYDLQE